LEKGRGRHSNAPGETAPALKSNVPSNPSFLFAIGNFRQRDGFATYGRQYVEVFAMLSTRKRERPATSLEERLLKFAEEARAAAKLITPGPEQDLLMRKARKAETLANATDRLAQG
jgi:hypothetical protein